MWADQSTSVTPATGVGIAGVPSPPACGFTPSAIIVLLYCALVVAFNSSIRIFPKSSAANSTNSNTASRLPRLYSVVWGSPGTCTGAITYFSIKSRSTSRPDGPLKATLYADASLANSLLASTASCPPSIIYLLLLTHPLPLRLDVHQCLHRRCSLPCRLRRGLQLHRRFLFSLLFRPRFSDLRNFICRSYNFRRRAGNICRL